MKGKFSLAFHKLLYFVKALVAYDVLYAAGVPHRRCRRHAHTLKQARQGLVPLVHFFVLALLSIPESASALKTLEGWSGLFKWKNIAFYAIATAVSLKTKLHPVVKFLFVLIFLGIKAVVNIQNIT